jgi:hypothetical protein
VLEGLPQNDCICTFLLSSSPRIRVRGKLQRGSSIPSPPRGEVSLALKEADGVRVKRKKSSSILLDERRTNGLQKITSSPFEKGRAERDFYQKTQ